MHRIELLEPFLRDGLRNTNFFNGRLLSAEDLSTEQEAARGRAAQLGEAVGAGVVRGLEVRETPPAPESPATLTRASVTVSKGLGINPAGQLLSLPEDAQVALVRERESAEPSAGLFRACEPPRTDTVAVGVGVYLLVLSPASGFAGRAPASGLGGTGATSPGCGSRYAVEGVQFRLLDLKVGTNDGIAAAARAELLALMRGTDEASLSKLRNLLAHACFGTAALAAFERDPFAAGPSPASESGYGALDALRGPQGPLTSCDLPLALIYWTGDGIRFVDMWSARRRPTPRPPAAPLAALASERRLREAEARFHQFQDQLQELIAAKANPQLLLAHNYFRYLPPAGLLPLSAAGAKGVGLDTFFSGVAHRPADFIDGATLEALLGEAAAHDPVDLAAGEMVWLYKVWQNARAAGGGGGGARPYAVFASPHVPYRALARFDVARWDYSNYAACDNCEF